MRNNELVLLCGRMVETRDLLAFGEFQRRQLDVLLISPKISSETTPLICSLSFSQIRKVSYNQHISIAYLFHLWAFRLFASCKYA